MQTTQDPYIKSLSHRGFIQGLTISKPSNNKHNNTPLCHYFGGVRYGLAPSQRWRRASPLPDNYSYGTKDQPGRCEGGAGVCPQPAFLGPQDQSAWSEDCFQCNVYVPVGEVPQGGLSSPILVLYCILYEVCVC